MDNKLNKVLPVKLTQEEVLHYSKELAKETQDLEEIEKRKKDVMADFGSQILKHKSEVGVLSRKISTGEEYRDIECEWNFDWKDGRKRLYRTDTGELLQTDKISDYERQQKLDLDEAG
ncbi:MAG: hypothetical protein KAR06_05600 [Deltaproteobacteria bacterium]|nr:hypothetical protein [Deltaproteobacteria bacterium]